MLEDLREKLRRTQQDKDVEDKKGTQPKKYYAKDADGDEMSKSTKDKRAAHFSKGGSTEPAPGDKGAETKPSQHTKKYKKMFGEGEQDECWDGYTQKGMKKKGDKMVPNCVPEEIEEKVDIKKALSKVKGLSKKQMEVLASLPQSQLVVIAQQLSGLVMGEQLEEGKLVAPAHQVIKTVAKEIQKKMENLYRKRESDGVKLVNQIAKMVGMTVSDKEQKKGTLFLRMGDSLQEDAAVDAAQLKAKHAEEMERLKANHEQELEALKDRHDRETKRVEGQKEKETQDKQIQSKRDADRKSAEKKRESQSEETIEERLADKLRDKEKSNQKAHQQRIIKLARQSIKKNKKEEVEEDRDYKKEYADYHSKPEQIKRRAKRNEARRILKDRKDIKGKDVHHKDNNPMNNDKSNLSIVSQKYNRSEPRLRKLKEKGLLPNGRK